jgi:hypothetical protein
MPSVDTPLRHYFAALRHFHFHFTTLISMPPLPFSFRLTDILRHDISFSFSLLITPLLMLTSSPFSRHYLIGDVIDAYYLFH